MAKEIFFNAARSKAIEGNAIVSGLVDSNGRLILSKFSGQTIDAGNVKGDKGDKGDNSRYMLPDTSSGLQYIRIATLDSSVFGAHFQVIIAGLGQRTQINPIRRSTILLQASTRNTDTLGITRRAWIWGTNPSLKVFYRQIGSPTFEIWMRVTSYQNEASLTELSNWMTTINLDSVTATAPTSPDLTEIAIQDSDYSPQAIVSDRADAISDNAIIKGVLEPTYRFGNAKVKVDGVLSSTTYPWMSPYRPEASREVRLLKTASGFMISGQVDDGYAPITLSSNWRTYGDKGAGSWSAPPRAVKLPSGLIVLDGMLASNSAPADASVIGTLPVGFRPENNMIVPVESGLS